MIRAQIIVALSVFALAAGCGGSDESELEQDLVAVGYWGCASAFEAGAPAVEEAISRFLPASNWQKMRPEHRQMVIDGCKEAEDKFD